MIKWTGNRIGDSGAIKISESLMMNTTLTELDLRCVIRKRELMWYNEETEGEKWNNDKMNREQNWRWRKKKDKWIINEEHYIN